MRRRHLATGLALVFALLLLAGSSHAAVDIVFAEQGGDVVATMSGTLNLTDLSSSGGGGQPGFVRPDAGFVMLAGSSSSFMIYQAIQTPPNSGIFGTGGATLASSFSGDILGIVSSGTPALRVPSAYVSGDPLSSTTTWNSATLASLGITQGTYTWSWGSGANADTATITVSAVPEPGTWLFLASAASSGAVVAWRRHRCRSAGC